MRILIDGIVFENDFQRGIQRSFYELLRRVGKREIVSLFLSSPQRARLPENCAVIQRREEFPVSRTNLPLRAWHKLRREWFPTRLPAPHVFHSTYFTFSPFPDVPQVVTVHDMIPELYRHLCGDWADAFAPIKQRALREAALVIAISQTTADDIVKVYPEAASKIRVILHGADHLSLPGSGERQPSQLRELGPFALFVGDRAAYKNFSLVMDALNEPSWPKDITLAVAGPPMTQIELEELDRRSIASRIRNLGRISEAQLSVLYNECIAVIFPSLAEGFGFPLLEAQTMGAPVVCSDIPVFHETGADSVCFFNPSDPSAIGNSLQRLLDPKYREQIRKAGQENAKRFSWDLCAEATVGTYHEAAAMATGGVLHA